MSKNGIFSGPHFPIFGLNTEIYGVNLRIQSEYKKIIRTGKNSVFEYFSRSEQLRTVMLWELFFLYLSLLKLLPETYCILSVGYKK